MVQININEGITIPQDVAKRWAGAIRGSDDAVYLRALADLLDPPPLSLREQVATHLASRPLTECDWPDTWLRAADAVLAVVADWLAAQPRRVGFDTVAEAAAALEQRAYDVRLLRGEES